MLPDERDQAVRSLAVIFPCQWGWARTFCNMSVLTYTTQFCRRCRQSMLISWSSRRLLANSPRREKNRKSLTLFHCSMTFNPSLISRRSVRCEGTGKERWF